ncbi:MAG: MFS transporter, partial [Balneolaceae bacterium]|nr:MFS transporter [Balneolaceae bacterium]
MWKKKSVQIGLLSLAELLAMALWFSATAVIPQWIEVFSISNAQQAWLTISVQIGFVAGAFLLSVFTISDRFPARYIFALSALAGALINAAIPYFDLTIATIIVLRFLTGMTLAGVYPTGMKIMTTWCREDRGLCIGILVGALTAGSSVPHLLNAISPAGAQSLPDWRIVLFGSSLLAVIASLISLFTLRTGPHRPKLAPFNMKYITESLKYKPVRLANFGYLGHMWELYAMWAWVPVMLLYSYQQADLNPRMARLAGFGVIAIGALGCVLAGRLADRLGRTTITTVSLLISGCCALSVGFLIAQPLLLTIVCLIWGFAVVADSAQ